MLIELLKIHRGLQEARMELPPRHPDIKPLAKRDVLRAAISTDLEVVSIDVVSSKAAHRFWTLRDGNHNSFPLVQLGTSNSTRTGANEDLVARLLDEKSELVERVHCFESLCGDTSLEVGGLLPWPSYRSRLDQRMHELDGLRDTRARNLLTLLQCVLSSDGEVLLQALDCEIIHKVRTAPEPTLLLLAAKLLFTGGGEVLLDAEGDFESRRACDHRNIIEISDVLNRKPTGEEEGRCSLSGAEGPLENGKLPQASLPVVGPTYLFAKNTDIPSAARYQVAGPKGFPIARDLAPRLNAAAELLVDPERQGQTWSPVPSELPRQYDLFLSFVPGVGSISVAGGLAEGVFEALANDLQKLAAGRAGSYSTVAEYVVIRKVDPGNRKIIFKTTSSLDQLVKAAARWTKGCENVPATIKYPIPLKKGEPVRRFGTRLIGPGRITSLGREVFTHRGLKKTQVPGPTFADAMRLFLGSAHNRARTCGRLLPVFLARHQPLLEGIAHASRIGNLRGFDAKTALDSVAALGLLLQEHTQKREKGDYMNDTAFLLGQLLAGADVLHRGYCEHQRSGALPPSLLGNQMLTLAQRQPATALAQLLLRIKVYYGWSKKYWSYRVDEKLRDRRELKARKDQEQSDRQWAIENAVFVVRRLQNLATLLHGKLPEQDEINDTFKAELLLGYLAGPPKAQKSDKSEASSQESQEENANVK